MLKHDLLVIDLEMSGLDPRKHEIIQLAGVLLDRKTLKEKASFNEYVKPKHWKNRQRAADKIHGLTEKFLKENGTDIKTVLKRFNTTFPMPVQLANWGNSVDSAFFQIAYIENKVEYPYNYLFLDTWPLAFVYFSRKKFKSKSKKFAGFELLDLVKHFDIKVEGKPHDALTDARMAAEVLKALIHGL